MDNGLGLLSSETTAIPIKADPRLKLLFELPPRYQVFLDNLADLLSPPKLPPLQITSAPGAFWPDVFVRRRIPWRSIQESIIWHMVTILLIWSLSGRGWVLHREPQVRHSARESHITYYPPSQTYSARTSSRPKTHARPRPQPVAAQQPPLEVPREAQRTPSLVVPPDLKLATAPRPDLASSSPAIPAVPLSATERARTPLPGGLGSVLPPPPDASGVSTQRAGAPPSNAAVIAPPPTLQGWMRKIESLFGDSSSEAGARVVPPPPSVPGTDGGTGRVSSLPGEGTQVVPPPPSVLGTGGGVTSLSSGGAPVIPPPPSVVGAGMGGRASLGGAGTQVVPPPPSVQGVGGGPTNSLSAGGSRVIPPPPSIHGSRPAGGRGGLLSANGTQVVPPPPSVQGVEGGRAHALSAGGSKVIPPPPSVQGAGGTGGAGERLGTLAGTGTRVVPPPPSVQGAGGGRDRLGSLSGARARVVPPPPSFEGTGSGGADRAVSSLSGPGNSVVPPPPSVQGTGGSGGGRIGSLSGAGTGVVPPPPSVQGTGGAGSRVGALSSNPGTAVVPPPPSVSGSGGSGGSGPLASLASAGAEVAPPPVGPAGGGGGPGPTGPLQQMDEDIPPGADLPPVADSPPPGPAEEFPLRLVSLALPTQGSSFFSNYEVFIAERRLPKGRSQLIKLVYTFLPYQKRLSEYLQSNALVHTWRVTREPKCDESLMQMTWSDAAQDPGDNPFPEADRNSKLPCYSITADDYQKALVRGQ